jgi:phosphoglycolate phosphatase-like HAD superfamily hydrolase
MVKKEKPHPEILLRILKRFKLKSSEALYVGDARSDIELAKKAKVKSIIITRGAIRNPREARKLGADFVFRNLSELLSAIKTSFRGNI